ENFVLDRDLDTKPHPNFNPFHVEVPLHGVAALQFTQLKGINQPQLIGNSFHLLGILDGRISDSYNSITKILTITARSNMALKKGILFVLCPSIFKIENVRVLAMYGTRTKVQAAIRIHVDQDQENGVIGSLKYSLGDYSCLEVGV